MPTHTYTGFSPSQLGFPSGTELRVDPTFAAASGYTFEITDDDGNWSGDNGNSGKPRDKTGQTLVVRNSLGGTVASGMSYLKEAYLITDEFGSVVRIFRVEIDGILVGFIADRTIQPGNTYAYSTVEITSSNEPAYSSLVSQTYDRNGPNPIQGTANGDHLDGGAGNDTIHGGAGNDTIWGGSGNDLIFGEDGDDSINGGGGNDTIHGGRGADTLHGGDGADLFVIGNDFGADLITGGEGGADDDAIDFSAFSGPVTVTYFGTEAGTVSGGPHTLTFAEVERLVLSDQADTANAASATAGVHIDARGGNDTVTGGSGNDTILGGAGADLLIGGAGHDSLDGGTGNDTLWGGTGNDVLTGGAGNDRFIYAVGDGHDTITDFNAGNSGSLADGDSANNDFIDLSGFYDNIWELHADLADDGVLNQSNASTPSGKAVDYSNNTKFGAGSLTFQGASADGNSFTVENTGVICFTSGTLIATPSGAVAIDFLRPGDLVLTRDNGPRRLEWIARRHLDRRELERMPTCRPIVIAPDLLGASAPLLVSPQHGLLLLMDGEERLVRARHLARLPGGKARVANGSRSCTYIHLMFEEHQIVFANGAACESFFPGRAAIGVLPIPMRREFARLFPDLTDPDVEAAYGATARKFARWRDLPSHLRDLGAVPGLRTPGR